MLQYIALWIFFFFFFWDSFKSEFSEPGHLWFLFFLNLLPNYPPQGLSPLASQVGQQRALSISWIFCQPAATVAKSRQSWPTLFDPTDGSPPGSAVPGILQARTLEWVAISFSNAWKWKVKVKSLCPARLLATPWTAAFQAPPSMGFSRQEYRSGVPLP